MNKVVCFIAGLVLLMNIGVRGQDAPNESNSLPLSTTAATVESLANMPVNLFTGVPQIGVPLYNYGDNNGLSMSLSLNYLAGGIRINEDASQAGSGWSLNAGGAISRTVKGRPDDLPDGFMSTPAIPGDSSFIGHQYYSNFKDPQQDVFHFNFPNHSGDFYIGKGGKIVLVPLNNALKINYTSDTLLITNVHNSSVVKKLNGITSFTITAPDGVKYLFDNTETEQFVLNPNSGPYGFASDYFGKTYATAWKLSEIIAPFNTDSIHLSYKKITDSADVGLPHSIIVNNSTKAIENEFRPVVKVYSLTRQLQSIELPDKTSVKIIYREGNAASSRYSAIGKVTIHDSIFRKGYLFDYAKNIEKDSLFSRADAGYFKLTLKRVIPYTSTAKLPEFTFYYYGFIPEHAPLGNDTLIQNAYDHWGFYNGNNSGKDSLGYDKDIPTVDTLYTGANRQPSAAINRFNIRAIKTPDGSSIFYQFEQNNIREYLTANQSKTVDAVATMSTPITINRVYNIKTDITFNLDKLMDRTAAIPLNVNTYWVCKVFNGSLSFSDTISLNKLFYYGSHQWSVNLPDGSYTMETYLVSGAVTATSFPINVQWENTAYTNYNVRSSGMRVNRIVYYNQNREIKAKQFKYVTRDSLSSGFGEHTPRYDMPFTKYSGTTPSNSTLISSKFYSNTASYGGSFIGHSRVEVTNGEYNANMGKEVYEFTDLQDAHDNISSNIFPIMPKTLPDWGLGLGKKTTLYDSSGRKVKSTTNYYDINNTTLTDTNHASIKLYYTSYKGFNKGFTGGNYCLQTGRTLLLSTTDSVFYKDNSYQTSTRYFTYDTPYYNVTKVSSLYDSTRGLHIEKRMYYPYNYTTTGILATMKDSNILRPVVASETWITGDNNPRMLAAEINQYGQTATGHLRPLAVAALQAARPLPLTTIGTFNPAQLNRNSTYLKTKNSFTRYDNKGNLLETKETATTRYNSLIRDYNNRYVVAKVPVAQYNDIAYTSFESDGTGNWRITANDRANTNAITGKLSYDLSKGYVAKAQLNIHTTYTITYWSTGSNTVVLAPSQTAKLLDQKGGWNLYEVRFTGIDSIALSGSGLIDELRLYPSFTKMETNCYEPMIGITATCDANNRIQYFEYDGAYRPVVVRDISKNIIKKFEYDSIVTINTLAKWTAPKPECARLSDTSTRMDWVQIDTNMYSDSFMVYKRTFYKYDCTQCVPICPSEPQYKLVNCHCEEAIKVYVKNLHNQELDGTYKCFYFYRWSDNSIKTDPSYFESSLTPCQGVDQMPVD